MRRMPIIAALVVWIPLSAQSFAQPASAPATQSTFLYQPSSLAWQPFRVWHGLIIADVDLDGRPVRAMLDTGSVTALADNDVPDHEDAVVVHNPGTPVPARLTRYQSLKFGGYRIIGGMAVRISMRKLGTVPFDMIMGSDILGGIALQIDWSRHRLRYLLAGDSAVPGPTIPIAVETAPGGQHYITTTITVCGTPIKAALDTGATSYAELAASAVPTDHCPAVRQSDVVAGSIGGPVVKRIVAFDRFAIGSLQLGALPLTVTDTASGPVVDHTGFMALIGNTALSRFNTTMDASAGRIVLWGPANTEPANYYGTIGIQLQSDAAKPPHVIHVMANSPAAVAGLQVGDQVCQINGIPLGKLVPDRLYYNPPVGASTAIGLCDGRRLTLIAQDFVGENAAFSAQSTQAQNSASAPLTEAAIGCSPEDDGGQPIRGRGDPRVCETLLAMPAARGGLRGEAAQSLAELDLDRKAFARAVWAATEAITASGASAPLHALRARAYAGLGRHAEALADAKAARALDPQLQDAIDIATSEQALLAR